jgi:hypothetical protein
METKYFKTRFDKLLYANFSKGNWRIVDRETMQPIGAIYKSKIELLCDVAHFAEVCGYAE